MTPIHYRSTNGGATGTTLANALLWGLAPDRGLFLPERVPVLDGATLRRLAEAPYPEVARTVLSMYTPGLVSPGVLAAICRDAYDFEVPLERVTGRRFLLRLDRGPTASFKDFAARMMGRLLGRLVKEADPTLVILTATSGDTGSAVAQAFAGVPGIEVVVLFPIDEVSTRQRRQMTTIGGNVTAVAVDGKFDDCQALVKRAFADPALGRFRLSSANSINIGRLLPQAVYYVYAALRVTEPGERAVVSVPCGNFGNLVGGLLARRMGAPIARFVVATNANDEVPVFFRTGRYAPVEPSRVCISNAMNVGHPSNLARLVDLYGGRLDERGVLHAPPDMDAIGRDLYATSVDDPTTRETLRKVWDDHGTLLEPHGAVAWAGLERWWGEPGADPDMPAISLETAHPAKFPDEVRAQTGREPELPPSLAAVEGLPERFERLDTDYGGFTNWLATWAVDQGVVTA